MENQKMSVVDILLRPDLPDVRKQVPEKLVELPRLSKKAEQTVIFRLRGLTYDQVRTLKEKPNSDRAVYAVLNGCVEPSWKDTRLLDKEKGIVTPIDAIKARLLAGEIDELYVEIQKLCGYLHQTVSDVKNA